HENLVACYRVEVTQMIDGVRRTVARGTGVALDARHLITANHVIAETGDVKIHLFNDEGDFLRVIPAKILRADPSVDLAMLETQEDLPHFVKFDYVMPKLGDRLYAVGAAWGDAPYTVTSGDFVSRHHEIFPDNSQASMSAPGGM